MCQKLKYFKPSALIAVRAILIIERFDDLCTQSPHIQTLLAIGARRAPNPDIEYLREPLQMKDGGKIHLDWTNTPEIGRETLILLHGLTGGSSELFVCQCAFARVLIVVTGTSAGWYMKQSSGAYNVLL